MAWDLLVLIDAVEHEIFALLRSCKLSAFFAIAHDRDELHSDPDCKGDKPSCLMINS
jgi:hypothetical protein